MLKYDPESGSFTWLARTGTAHKGQEAGTETEKGYIQIRVDDLTYYAQRLAWLYMVGEFPVQRITFENGNKLDIRWNNLKLVIAKKTVKRRIEVFKNG